MAMLISRLLKEKRLDDLQKATEDKEYYEQLIKEYNIKPDVFLHLADFLARAESFICLYNLFFSQPAVKGSKTDSQFLCN